ncbi:MAG: DUF3598 family protein [Brasilonema octagenarum HA4186-MV1]|jgi:hypothetical protein|nr:DUF3598 family protein [Brasilonema octagenarum HA4186-MV1]
MKSQWDCVLQNLGEWHGSFTRVSPQGELMEDIKSVIYLEGVNDNQAIHLVLRRYYPTLGSEELQPQDLVLDFSSPGVGSRYFETGAFCEGPVYFGSRTPFGAEFSFIGGDSLPVVEEQQHCRTGDASARPTANPVLPEQGSPNLRFGATRRSLVGQYTGDRRMRLIQQFDSSNSQLYRLTLVREQRAGTNAPERPTLVLEDLLGEWEGIAVTLYLDSRPPVTTSTTLKLARTSQNECVQHLFWGEEETQHTMTIAADSKGSRLDFDHESLAYQVLLLPDGASSTCPTQIKPGHPFFLEVGWLFQPGLRQRMIRAYNDQGKWSSLTFVNEHRIS